MTNAEILDALAAHDIEKVLLLTKDEEARSEARRKRIERKEKFCIYFGKAFMPTNNRQIFCSRDCLAKGTKEKITLIRKTRQEKREKREVKEIACAVCGKLFRPKNTKQTYCGEDCRRKVAMERMREYRKAHPQQIAEYNAKAHKERVKRAREKGKKMESIDRIAALARAAGMSYGKYSAMMRLKKEQME